MTKKDLHNLKKEYGEYMSEARGLESVAKEKDNGESLKALTKSFAYRIQAIQLLVEGIFEYISNQEDKKDAK